MFVLCTRTLAHSDSRKCRLCDMFIAPIVLIYCTNVSESEVRIFILDGRQLGFVNGT